MSLIKSGTKAAPIIIKEVDFQGKFSTLSVYKIKLAVSIVSPNGFSGILTEFVYFFRGIGLRAQRRTYPEFYYCSINSPSALTATSVAVSKGSAGPTPKSALFIVPKI